MTKQTEARVVFAKRYVIDFGKGVMVTITGPEKYAEQVVDAINQIVMDEETDDQEA
jgi:hypothetical protein